MNSAERVAGIAVAVTIGSLVLVLAGAAAIYPCDPPNILPRSVCGMDSFAGSPPRQMPVGWTPFVLSGDLTYMRDEDSTSPPSLRMWSDGGIFKAGMFTQTQVTPGAGYRASIEWAAPSPADTDTFGRRLGIDSTGGVDPKASTVVWGPVHWGPGRIMNYPAGKGPNLDIKARALGQVMTVFVLVDHPASTGSNLIFIDTISLFPDETAPMFPTYWPVVKKGAER